MPPRVAKPPKLKAVHGTKYFISDMMLGEGGFGKIYLGSHQRHGPLAIKVSPIKLIESTKIEASALRNIRNLPHVLRFRKLVVAPRKSYLITDVVQGHSLYELPISILKRDIDIIVRQIAEGLAAIHRKGLVHRDIKPSNIMYHPKNGVTIIDFGVACTEVSLKKKYHIDGVEKCSASDAGTPEYKDPACPSKSFTTKSDIYGFGVVLHDILAETGDTRPWLKKLTAAALNPSPCKRPSASAILRMIPRR
jgi:serine/threonine protein kinase